MRKQHINKGKAQSGPGEMRGPNKRWTEHGQRARARFTPQLDAFDWGTIVLIVGALMVIFSGAGA